MPIKQSTRLAVVVPMFNEEQGAAEFVTKLDRLDPGADCHVDLLVVDDGSLDLTVDRLKACVTSRIKLRIIRLSRNFGKEAAILAGLDRVDHDAVIVMDGDLEHPVDCIPGMIEAWREGVRVVRMRRTDRSAEPLWRRFMVKLFYRLLRISGEVPQVSDASDFCLLDRSVVDSLRHFPERNRMFKGLVAWCGFPTRIIDYKPSVRRSGGSRFSASKLIGLAIQGITSFSNLPLRIWTVIGTVVALAAVLYALQIILQVISYGRDVPGYASLMVSVLFLGGVQLICLGVLGEYIGKIYSEVKQRPHYLVREDSDRHD